MMGTKNADLPSFTFPVVAWAPQVATGDDSDDGIRMFASLHELTRTYMPKADTRLGWTFVDARGRCWEAVSAKVIGRAEPWPKSLLPNFFRDPEYRLVFGFAERPSMSFAKVRNRLIAAIKANPRHYSGGYGFDRRNELLAAKTLEELAKPDWLKNLEARPPDPLWRQWLFWEGRASRLEFLAAFAGIVATCSIVFRIAPTAPAVVTMVILSGAVAMSATARRLHDLRLSAWWLAPWWIWSWLCASIHDLARATGGPAVAFWLWWIPNLCVFGCLSLSPGVREANRYGFASRWGRLHHSESDGDSV